MEGQGAYIFGPSGPTLSDDEAAFFREVDPFGFILFARNCVAPDQLVRLTGDLRSAVGRDAPVLIDQEGGRVQRMRAPQWREYLPPLDQVERAGENIERAMFLRACLIGAELRDVGIDVNCIPTLDIASQDTHPFLLNRCYGRNASTVIHAARGTIAGLAAAGILPVLKHAPGHGRANIDSHHAVPRIETPLAELANSDFVPFKTFFDAPFVMTGHVILPELDPDLPVTQSKDGIGFLRGSLGLEGFLMTDDISMNALSGGVSDRASAALQAGCDAVLHCNGDLAEMQAVAAISGRLTPEAKTRAKRALQMRKGPDPIDIRAMEEELAMLQTGGRHAGR